MKLSTVGMIEHSGLGLIVFSGFVHMWAFLDGDEGMRGRSREGKDIYQV